MKRWLRSLRPSDRGSLAARRVRRRCVTGTRKAGAGPRPPGRTQILVRLVLALSFGAAVVLAAVHLREDDQRAAAAPVVSASPGSASPARPVAPPSSTLASTAPVPAAAPLPTQPTAPPCDQAAAIRSWPLPRRLSSLIIASVDPTNDVEARRAITDVGVGGIFLRGRSNGGIVADGTLAAIRETAPAGLFIAIDEEGGRIERSGAFGDPLPSARVMAATMTPGEVTTAAAARGRALRQAGIDLNFAPVLDLSDAPADDAIGDRSFGTDPDVVAAYAGAFAQGLSAAGVTPVLKHFPGHGRADGDSHKGPVNTPPIEALQGTDLQPYAELLPDAEAVMVGHLTVPGLSDGQPASLSREAVTGLLREQLRFDGLVVTDDLSLMRAVTDRYTPADAAARAVAAGADLVLLRAVHVAGALDALVNAVADGAVNEDQVTRSVQRTLRTKELSACDVSW